MQGYDPRTSSYPIPSQPAATPQVMQVPSSGARPKEDKSDYTRTLVGPLTANAARLLDDKKQPGIFFTFQDLSVRTEGTELSYNTDKDLILTCCNPPRNRDFPIEIEVDERWSVSVIAISHRC